MRWRRAMVTTVVGLGLTGLLAATASSPMVRWLWMPLAAFLQWSQWSVSGRMLDMLVTAVIVGICALPGVLMAVLICTIGKPPHDSHTRCGNCGYILKGLTEPRCPECGEGI